MKIWWSGGIVPFIFNLGSIWSESPASGPGCFTPEEKVTGASLDSVTSRNIPCPDGN
jgi:hypothetical protein